MSVIRTDELVNSMADQRPPYLDVLTDPKFGDGAVNRPLSVWSSSSARMPTALPPPREPPTMLPQARRHVRVSSKRTSLPIVSLSTAAVTVRRAQNALMQTGLVTHRTSHPSNRSTFEITGADGSVHRLFNLSRRRRLGLY